DRTPSFLPAAASVRTRIKGVRRRTGLRAGPPPIRPEMQGDKIRFRFAKTGDLRFVSHLDLMRCLERMLRRAAVPFKSTACFHPTPRLVLALSLPLGVAGRNEVLELELT